MCARELRLHRNREVEIGQRPVPVDLSITPLSLHDPLVATVVIEVGERLDIVDDAKRTEARDLATEIDHRPATLRPHGGGDMARIDEQLLRAAQLVDSVGGIDVVRM